MRILAAGGGSGGHVSPVVAVINEIARERSDIDVLFVCDKAFETQARGLVEQGISVPVVVRMIVAGKFRRYTHLTKLRQLLMPRILLANFRDIFKIGIGFLQSIMLIRRFRPDVMFAKGGYVCLPLGMAAHVLGVPIVVHDSDTRAGLTNRVLGRWAKAIATGSPLENYRYPASISRYVGVPIGADFHPYDEPTQRVAKRKLGLSESRPLIVVTGGGLGAESINTAVLQAAPRLLADDVQIYHVTGRKHFDQVNALAIKDISYQIVPFVYEGMADILGAADIVVSRASATFIQELAGLAKAVILVPSKALGDQRKNAEVYDNAHAAVVVSDDQLMEPNLVYDELTALLKDDERRKTLARRLNSFARPNAAKDVARMVVDTALIAMKDHHRSLL